MRDRNYTTGAMCGLASAALFGLSAPLSKLLLPSVSPWLLAALLYLGAGIGLSVVRLMGPRRSGRANHLRRQDLPLLAGVIVAGGGLGPVLLLIGLTRVSGVVGSLLLNLEGVFTVVLAVIVFGDRLTRAEAFGAALVLLGAVVVSAQAGAIKADGIGVLAIVGACLSWGLDNNLTQRLSIRDPIQIVQVKTLAAGAGNFLLAMLAGTALAPSVVAPAVLLGFFSYGLSIVLDVYALRYVGAAREAAFFATAPFVGALIAVPVLHERLGSRDYLGGGLMAAGLALAMWTRAHVQKETL